MPTFVDKSEVVDLLRGQFDAIAALCSTLFDDQWDQPTCLPGWTVRDVLSHVIGTESMLAGEKPPPTDTSHLHHMRNPIAEANEVWVESMRSLSGSKVLDRFDEVTGRRMVALEAMTQADFDAPSWTPVGDNETYGRFMRIRHYDCFMHEHDIRGAVHAPPRAEVADLRSALKEVSAGLGYIVGRRAALPEGSRVRIDLTGQLTVTYLIEVRGRATVVDSFDQPPTVGLEMPVTLFLRLTGGRDDGRTIPDPEIRFTGNRTLGESLMAHLAFTI